MDSSFRRDQTLSFGPKRHAISFQSSGDMIMNNRLSRNSGMVNSGLPGYAQIGNSGASGVSNSVPGLKHDASLAVEWSGEEQCKLEEGISIYANEPNIMKDIKIAATMPDKTVRDVALRCRWMMSKRRKQDEFNSGKMLKDKKDQLVEISPKPVISSNSTMNVAPFSVTTNIRIQSHGIPLEALSASTSHLLEQNRQVLGQISANISALKLQDNVNLFSQAKNNITAILNDMTYIPGPPLPISLNADLVNTILPSTSQMMTFRSSSKMHLKQEPDY